MESKSVTCFTQNTRRALPEHGIATRLMSALAVAVVLKVNYEQHLQGTDSGNNVAFYGAEAGMEKMVADLNALYKAQAAPGCNDIAKLTSRHRSLL